MERERRRRERSCVARGCVGLCVCVSWAREVDVGVTTCRSVDLTTDLPSCGGGVWEGRGGEHRYDVGIGVGVMLVALRRVDSRRGKAPCPSSFFVPGENGFLILRVTYVRYVALLLDVPNHRVCFALPLSRCRVVSIKYADVFSVFGAPSSSLIVTAPIRPSFSSGRWSGTIGSGAIGGGTIGGGGGKTREPPPLLVPSFACRVSTDAHALFDGMVMYLL